jgi:hypothetical protein
MPRFVPGLELNEGFYRDAVEPLLRPWPHSAALLGEGSEILSFDTERSTDHGWGPRLQVFVAPHDVADARAAVEVGLPDRFRGWPTRYGWDDTPVQHHVRVAPLGAWLESQLGIDPRGGLAPLDWLLIPQQQLLGVVRGRVYRDDLGELAAVRARLRWFPDQVWIWMLACAWRRIEQEEAFVGRSAEAGDELGSRLVAARLVRELMRLCFLLQRSYWPYAKWFGSAFARLRDEDGLGDALARVLAAPGYARREAALVEAYELVAARHNAAALTAPADPTVRPYHSRPFRVLHSERFVGSCLAEVSDPWLRSQPLVGSVDQFADSTDALYPERARRLGAVYVNGPQQGPATADDG